MSNRSHIEQDPIRFVEKLTTGQADVDNAIQEVFQFQLRHHGFYRRFSESLYPELTKKALLDSKPFPTEQLPLIPIRAFKELNIQLDRQFMHKSGTEPSGGWLFKSSGTSQMIRSNHYVPIPELYKLSVRRGFAQAYPEFVTLNDKVKSRHHAQEGISLQKIDFTDEVQSNLPILSYLPGYRDNPHSSLIRMMDILSESIESQMISDPEELHAQLNRLQQPVLLFGAAFGFIDFLERYPNSKQVRLPEGSVLIETGGMKTHRREMTKRDLIEILSNGFRLSKEDIHSEYGMCEMLSQSYSKGSEWFTPPPWLIFQIRHPDQPLRALPSGKRGKLGFIDLCNLFSCPFVLTDDDAELNEQGQVRIHGRWPGEESRGCNFLIDRD